MALIALSFLGTGDYKEVSYFLGTQWENGQYSIVS